MTAARPGPRGRAMEGPPRVRSQRRAGQGRPGLVSQDWMTSNSMLSGRPRSLLRRDSRAVEWPKPGPAEDGGPRPAPGPQAAPPAPTADWPREAVSPGVERVGWESPRSGPSVYGKLAVALPSPLQRVRPSKAEGRAPGPPRAPRHPCDLRGQRSPPGRGDPTAHARVACAQRRSLAGWKVLARRFGGRALRAAWWQLPEQGHASWGT